MKKYIVNFVLSNKGKYYHDDFVGLEIIAEDMKELFNLLAMDIDNAEESISDRIIRTVEESGLVFDTYTPAQIGEFKEKGEIVVVWEDEEYRFDDETTH